MVHTLQLVVLEVCLPVHSGAGTLTVEENSTGVGIGIAVDGGRLAVSMTSSLAGLIIAALIVGHRAVWTLTTWQRGPLTVRTPPRGSPVTD